MNPTILPAAIGKIVGQTGFFDLSMATGLEKKNSKFKPVKLRLKINLVSHPACTER